ncbi:hypothetical protein BJX63DRAFT_11716 [Aspergillus granulosus]|uniref:Uncharacterized protein n=1 Tax=Aspergillus granulosus TaxID=176169 RepID=A0ABR4HVH8_9EURO
MIAALIALLFVKPTDIPYIPPQLYTSIIEQYRRHIHPFFPITNKLPRILMAMRPSNLNIQARTEAEEPPLTVWPQPEPTQILYSILRLRTPWYALTKIKPWQRFGWVIWDSWRILAAAGPPTA